MKTITQAFFILLAGTFLFSAAVFADRHEEAPDGETPEYFNAGKFIKTDQRWQAVAWQATRIPAE